MSVYFGCITMVLKFPFTSAASTNGLHRYSGFCTGAGLLGLEGGNDSVEFEGNVAEVGVVDRFGGRGARDIDRLQSKCEGCSRANTWNRTHPRELRKDMLDAREEKDGISGKRAQAVTRNCLLPWRLQACTKG